MCGRGNDKETLFRIPGDGREYIGGKSIHLCVHESHTSNVTHLGNYAKQGKTLGTQVGVTESLGKAFPPSPIAYQRKC